MPTIERHLGGILTLKRETPEEIQRLIEEAREEESVLFRTYIEEVGGPNKYPKHYPRSHGRWFSALERRLDLQITPPKRAIYLFNFRLPLV